MDPFDLPPELAALERQLASRSHPQPSADFRRRVLSGLQDDRPSGPYIWRLALLAAAILLFLNLTMSLENHRSALRIQHQAGEEVETIVGILRQGQPDLSEQEAYRLALLVQAPPALPPSPPAILPGEGEESWDLR